MLFDYNETHPIIQANPLDFTSKESDMLSWTTREKKLAALAAIAVLLLVSLLFYVWRIGQDDEPVPFSPYSVEDESKEAGQEELEPIPDETMIWVDVKGAVVHPGVYELTEDARVYLAIERSGGFKPDAETRGVNLAKRLQDGELVYVPMKGEHPPVEITEERMSGAKPKININAATVEELTTLPGIGGVKAAAIVDYRDKNGKFQKESDLTKVTGIGEKSLERVKDLISVR